MSLSASIDSRSSSVSSVGAGFHVRGRPLHVSLPPEGTRILAHQDISLAGVRDADQFVDGPGAREGDAAVDLHAAGAGENLVARIGLRGGGDGVSDAVHAASGQAEEFRFQHVDGYAGAHAAVHFDAV